MKLTGSRRTNNARGGWKEKCFCFSFEQDLIPCLICWVLRRDDPIQSGLNILTCSSVLRLPSSLGPWTGVLTGTVEEEGLKLFLNLSHAATEGNDTHAATICLLWSVSVVTTGSGSDTNRATGAGVAAAHSLQHSSSTCGRERVMSLEQQQHGNYHIFVPLTLKIILLKVDDVYWKAKCLKVGKSKDVKLVNGG